MNSKTTEILSTDSLEIGYVSGRHKTVLLPPVTASAHGGELIAVIGRNGIGKSTLLRTIIGLQESLGGKIKIKGTDITAYSRTGLAKISAYLSTEIIRISNMTVYNMVAMGRFPHTNWIGRIDTGCRQAISGALDKTGMTEFRARSISELSDGERQKVMIARMLAQDPEIMIMDEPTAFLDITSKYDIATLMLNLARDGKTIIFSTHDLNIALNMADRVWLILEEQLIEGSPETLINSGAFNRLFESSVVSFDPETRTVYWKNGSRDHLKYFL